MYLHIDIDKDVKHSLQAGDLARYGPACDGLARGKRAAETHVRHLVAALRAMGLPESLLFQQSDLVWYFGVRTLLSICVKYFISCTEFTIFITNSLQESNFPRVVTWYGFVPDLSLSLSLSLLSSSPLPFFLLLLARTGSSLLLYATTI